MIPDDHPLKKKQSDFLGAGEGECGVQARRHFGQLPLPSHDSLLHFGRILLFHSRANFDGSLLSSPLKTLYESNENQESWAKGDWGKREPNTFMFVLSLAFLIYLQFTQISLDSQL